MATVSQRSAVPTSAGDLARRTTLGVLVAVVALLLVRAVAFGLGTSLGGAGPQNPFALSSMLGSAVVAGVGAAVAYAVLVRFTERPVRNFVALATLVFVGMLAPVLVVTPTLGVTPVGQAVLVVFHVAVAVPLVAFIVGAVRL